MCDRGFTCFCSQSEESFFVANPEGIFVVDLDSSAPFQDDLTEVCLPEFPTVPKGMGNGFCTKRFSSVHHVQDVLSLFQAATFAAVHSVPLRTNPKRRRLAVGNDCDTSSSDEQSLLSPPRKLRRTRSASSVRTCTTSTRHPASRVFFPESESEETLPEESCSSLSSQIGTVSDDWEKIRHAIVEQVSLTVRHKIPIVKAFIFPDRCNHVQYTRILSTAYRGFP